MSKKIEYPLWETDIVTDRIADDYYFSIELRDGGSGVIRLTEVRLNEDVRWNYREYVDTALMAPEHFRMVVEHFLRDTSSRRTHSILASDEVLNKIVALKIELESKKASRIADGILHCGAIHEHGGHYHMEGPYGFFCEGWTND